ncbi:probable pyridoxal reductase, chloroplastic at C-terminar half [Coccomyxa sp. Obi]|nr:probable pyridoxal reductase, chloroplastic at C-terminar half [Coccomyxa sp. Obi]
MRITEVTSTFDLMERGPALCRNLEQLQISRIRRKKFSRLHSQSAVALFKIWDPRAKLSRRLGPLVAPPMGLGTWAWGNQFLWGYEEGMDGELQELFNYALSKGVTLFDTADSYALDD